MGECEPNNASILSLPRGKRCLFFMLLGLFFFFFFKLCREEKSK